MRTAKAEQMQTLEYSVESFAVSGESSEAGGPGEGSLNQGSHQKTDNKHANDSCAAFSFVSRTSPPEGEPTSASRKRWPSRTAHSGGDSPEAECGTKAVRPDAHSVQCASYSARITCSSVKKATVRCS
jgi:hypothetical protein